MGVPERLRRHRQLTSLKRLDLRRNTSRNCAPSAVRFAVLQEFVDHDGPRADGHQGEEQTEDGLGHPGPDIEEEVDDSVGTGLALLATKEVSEEIMANS